jgi:hypothetical protein
MALKFKQDSNLNCFWNFIFQIQEDLGVGPKRKVHLSCFKDHLKRFIIF